MAVTSPTSASPGLSLLEWDEGAVQSWLSHIGLPQYEDVVHEHGITGDVLAVMDHASLIDLGINSIGHRLNLLRAVWELKKEQGIELGEEDWKPEEHQEKDRMEKLWGLIVEQQERLVHLEKNQARLLASLEGAMDSSVNLDKNALASLDGSFDKSVLNNVKPPLNRQASEPIQTIKGSTAMKTKGSSSTSNEEDVTSIPSSLSKEIQPSASAVKAANDKKHARDAARSAAKSFRVTLDDPCFNVLPAALQKYKINDDWKLYALFICYSTAEDENIERCLSYDEKPLLLFQRLKESGQKPVFMLRHLKDIRSPIAVAQTKQAIKLGLPPMTTENLLPKIRPASDTSTSPTKASGLMRRAIEEGQASGIGGNFPELPSPGIRDSAPKSANRTLVDKDGTVHSVSYAVAIYPYIADRQDEFDVAVGACFIIMSKVRGWFIVQRDPAGMGNVVPDQTKSGWVPAGCLLELHTPIAILSPPKDPAYPGLSPIPSQAIMSSSYPGTVLMDWEAKADDQITLKAGENVRVYKKYVHWSYAIRQDAGERGWVPAWFISKQSSSSGDGATPTQTPASASTTDLDGDL